MNKEQILEIAKNLISIMQMKTKLNTQKTELVYLMGYNDGVLDFYDELADLLEKAGEQSE